MSNLPDNYAHVTRKIAHDLKTIAAAPQISELSHLTLPEIEALSEQIAQVVPAGNVPGLILNGLMRIEGRQVPISEQQRHLGLLFQGIRSALDKAIYGAMFAGPAAVIIGYQKLLQLAGKDVEAAFPDGTWQFYLEFALREDSARHANETTGFQRSLAAHQIRLSDTDRLTAWIMAAFVTIQTYDRLLENEWRERVHSSLLKESAPAVSSAWEAKRPYQRGQDAGNDDYPAYRRRKFNEVMQPFFDSLSTSDRRAFVSALTRAEQVDLPAYQRQMSILARLEPGRYQETRSPYMLAESGIGIIYRGHYTLLPTLTEGRPTDIHTLRGQITTLLSQPINQEAGDLDLLLVRAGRSTQPDLRAKADRVTQNSLNALGYTPILLNWDQGDARLSLAAIRQGRRGIGDHALTLFFTPESTIFDQSHIFFDGAWGAALAEIMTNEALSWALYLSQLPAAVPTQSRLLPLTLNSSPNLRKAAEEAQIGVEVAAETTTIRLGSVLTLRRLFKTRSDLVNVTVNDLLVLYRSLHGFRYEPSSKLRGDLEALHSDKRPAAQEAYRVVTDALDKIKRLNPAILIPMDASQGSPRERLYPTTFRNPIPDFLSHHDATLLALHDYKKAHGNRAEPYAIFDERQRTYLRMIASFGLLMRKYKEIALSGQSISTVSIKLLAHIPDAIQALLDQIPGRFDVLNEIIKGEEVFSNVGRVARGSTLRRFITAKDDNQQKTLAWGVVTDDQDIVHLSLRDFRPHVTVLYENGMLALATLITQDFLEAYADGFNQFIRELRDITVASRETRSQHEKDDHA